VQDSPALEQLRKNLATPSPTRRLAAIRVRRAQNLALYALVDLGKFLHLIGFSAAESRRSGYKSG
jgi:hypothetical protein